MVAGIALALLCPGSSPAWAADRPAVMLARSYHADIALADYWVSEKYDGVRAYWDGRQLLTRGGQRIAAPAWFTAGWPAHAMDGELWAGRGRFEAASAAAARDTPDEAQWLQLRYMVFDLPEAPGAFDARLPALQAAVARIDRPWVVAVVQRKLASTTALQALLRETVKAGGEGLMLHRGDAPYRGERTDDLLKLKPFEDAEARVVGYQPGRGKHAGRLGALEVETPEGLRLRLGSGFSDAQREDPPALGSWVTYRYRGLNASGIPRFASFLRVRSDWPPLAP
ncbi:DNA ligase [Niveibacterium sp. SC-1]|uniref:DNA ligase n=1 Tax=Niveibacterium sp. SC-1 TaxID=3135646 RepID=UPI00311EA0D8